MTRIERSAVALRDAERELHRTAQDFRAAQLRRDRVKAELVVRCNEREQRARGRRAA